MRIDKQPSVATALILGAFAAACWSVATTIRGVSAMYARVGVPDGDFTLWSVDISPDTPQRELAIAFALLTGVVAFWSRRAALISIISAGVVYFSLETVWWVYMPIVLFDHPAPITHLLAGAAWAAGAGLYRAGRWRWVAAMAPMFVVASFVEWAIETARMRAAAEAVLQGPIPSLRDVLYGGRWDHVLVGVLAICSALALARRAARQHSSKGEAELAVAPDAAQPKPFGSSTAAAPRR